MKEIIKKKAGKLCLILLVSVLLESVDVQNSFAVSPSDINNSNVFLEQAWGSVDCTAVAATMMLRRRAILNRDENWKNITPEAVKSVAWINGLGLRSEFSYGDYAVNSEKLPADKTGFLIDLLKNHPEGVVVHSNTEWHAMLITDYTDGQFYCGEPATNWGFKGRIPVSSSSMKTVDVCSKYWYISTPYQGYTEGWIQVGAVWKYQRADGSFLTGWQNVDGKYYYLNGSGEMLTGWQNIGGKYYFLYNSGEMATGRLELDDGYYYLGSDGAMYTSHWISEAGNRYYVGSDGKMLRNICSKINGTEYDFDNNGAAKKSEDQLPVLETKPVPETKPVLETSPVKQETTAPSTDASMPERKVTEYSYRTRTKKEETKTSETPNLSGWECTGTTEGNKAWGSWSDWSGERRENSSDTQVETRTVSTGDTTQIYLGRYYSASKNKFSPDKLDDTYSFEGGWFDEKDVTFVGQAYAGGRTDCYTIPGYGYYFFEIGSHGGEIRTVSTGSQTEYRYRSKTAKTVYQYHRYVYSGWSDWSGWSESLVAEDEFTEVRTRIQTK